MVRGAVYCFATAFSTWPFTVISFTTPAAIVVPMSRNAKRPSSGKSLNVSMHKRPQRCYLDDRGVTGLYRLWLFLGRLTGPWVDLCHYLRNCGSDLRSVRVEHGSVTGSDSGRVEDNYDLRPKRLCNRRWIGRRSQY